MAKNYSSQILQDNKFRFWVSLFVFFVGSLLTSNQSSSSFFRIMLLFACYAATFGLTTLYAKEKESGLFLSYGLIVLDVLAITAAIYLTGRFQSPLYVLYLVVFGLCIYRRSLTKFIYASVLSFSLYVGLSFILPEPVSFSQISAQVALLAVLTGALYAILFLIEAERRENETLVSQSNTLARIANNLSGSITNPKDNLRTVSDLIEQEMKQEGFECRIAIHKSDERYLPPSGGRLGVHIPIMVGDCIGGTLIITREKNKTLKPSEQNFFSSIAHSVGLYLHRAKIWEDFQGQLEKIEASLLLNSPYMNNPQGEIISDADTRILKNMVEMIRHERGKWMANKEVCDFKALLLSEMPKVFEKSAPKRIAILVESDLDKLPQVVGDPIHLRQLVSHLLFNAVSSSPIEGKVKIKVQLEKDQITMTVMDQAEAGAEGPISISLGRVFEEGTLEKGIQENPLNLGLVICKKIVDAHQGIMWAESKGPQQGRLFAFTIPLVPPVQSVKVDENVNDRLVKIDS